MAKRSETRPANAISAGATERAVPGAAPSPTRITAIDGLRGLALLLMIVYHFCFDLRWKGVLAADFEHDLFWLGARTFILSSFLLLAGVSLVLADQGGHRPGAFWRQVGKVAGCALLVSAASFAIFPRTFIWFGVLHAIAVSLVMANPLRQRPGAALAAGIIVITAGLVSSNALFDNRWLGWLGFMTAKPATEDYVPLFPWTGVLLLGIPLGHALVRRQFAPVAFATRLPPLLTFAGRHSLLIYMVHQPVLLGVLALIIRR